MERSSFLVELAAASRGVRDFLNEDGKIWLSGIITGRREDGSEMMIDRIFELICYFTLMNAFRTSAENFRLICPPGRNGYRFPYGPGDKQNLKASLFSRSIAVP